MAKNDIEIKKKLSVDIDNYHNKCRIAISCELKEHSLPPSEGWGFQIVFIGTAWQTLDDQQDIL